MTQTDRRTLDQPIPHDALITGWGQWPGHDAFPTFSWSWWLRRGRVFWPIALIYGMMYGTWHAAGMNAWGDWLPLALRGSLAGLVMVSTGPLLATGVRYLGLPVITERVLVALAIIIGVAVALAADDWVGRYHSALMARFNNHDMHPPVPWLFLAISNLMRLSLDGGTLVIIFVAGGFSVVHYFTERRRLAAHAARRELETLRTARDAADMRLAVLQAQVEPHFLFNTLASVRSLVPTDPARAVATIDAMADYLRSTLPAMRDSTLEDATLGKQIDICARYLDLMNIRMDGRLTVVIDADDTVRARPFPPLILISLVENAVKHGIEPKPGPGTIAIRARLDHSNQLEVAVEDDGLGLTPGPSHGLGLANVRAQLRNRFGDSAALDIASRPEGGTRAAITLATT